MNNKPKKNYFLLFGICLCTILLAVYINKWALAFKKTKLDNSPLNNSVYVLSADELTESINELNKGILYVSYTGSEKIYRFEKMLLKKIDKDSLNDYILYIDMKDQFKNEKYIVLLNAELNSDLLQDLKLPAFIYIENGKIIEIADSKDSMVTIEDFQSLVSKYNIGS